MHDFLVVNGREPVQDPGLAQLRRYLPVLAVIGAPYAAGGGNYEPVNTLDPVMEWATLVEVLGAVPQYANGKQAPLALARLMPPTPTQLREALADDGPDGFRVVHFVASSDAGALALEDEQGQEYLIGAEPFVQLFAESSADIIVLDGCFTQEIAELLVDRTPVKAVIGTRRRLPTPNAAAFSANFYAALSEGQDIHEAFRVGVRALERMPGGGADRYDLVMPNSRRAERVVLPDRNTSALHPLLIDGQPSVVSVSKTMPLPEGFIGRMAELAALAGHLGEMRDLLLIAGPTGVGKSWLAAMAAQRFGWRFPDGVLWVTCGPQMSGRTIAAQIARMVHLPETLSMRDLLAELQQRQLLLILDDIDQIGSTDEVTRVVKFARAISAQTGSRVLGTSRGAVGPLLIVPEEAVLWLDRFDQKAARTLAMRLAVERGLDVLDVDTIDDFMDSAQGIPWLIAAGVGWIESEGISRALSLLETFPSEDDDPLAAHVVLQLEQVRRENRAALRLLRRAAGLPDAFDHRLAHGLGGDDAQEQIDQLIAHDLLTAEGDLLEVPPLVRSMVMSKLALEPAHRAQVDRVVMTYLTHIWPAGKVKQPLSRAEWALLNNARALLMRYLVEGQGGDPVVMARLLIAVGETFRAVGLAHECAGFSRRVLARLPESTDPDRVRLQITFASCAQDEEASMVFGHLVVQPNLDPVLQAEAGLAYGRSLIAAGQVEEAASALADAFHTLRSQPRPDIVLASAILHCWGRALSAAGRDSEAIERYRETLQAYARLERPDLAAQALYELGDLLARNIDENIDSLDRAGELYQRALSSAEQAGDRELSLRIRAALATLHVRRADSAGANGDKVQELNAADTLLTDLRLDALACCAESRLVADLLHQHAQVQARKGAFTEATETVARSVSRYTWLGDAAAQANALIDFGRFAMAAGDSISAQDALHEAFDLGTQHEMPEVQAAAAGVLVRVHQIRARHAQRADAEFASFTVLKAQESRTLLGYHGFDNHASALDQVIMSLA